jgi:hypothetical protein
VRPFAAIHRRFVSLALQVGCNPAHVSAGAPTYQDIVCLGRISAVVAVKLKELRRSMFWIGHSR